jgi:hypothetical protein
VFPQRFVKHKIIQEAHVMLGKANLTAQESEGLGDTFVLTNPRLPDHPIVLVSDGFVDVTGYPKAQIIGRNCRTSYILFVSTLRMPPGLRARSLVGRIFTGPGDTTGERAAHSRWVELGERWVINRICPQFDL